jgi:hypothetical protein
VSTCRKISWEIPLSYKKSVFCICYCAVWTIFSIFSIFFFDSLMWRQYYEKCPSLPHIYSLLYIAFWLQLTLVPCLLIIYELFRHVRWNGVALIVINYVKWQRFFFYNLKKKCCNDLNLTIKSWSCWVICPHQSLNIALCCILKKIKKNFN